MPAYLSAPIAASAKWGSFQDVEETRSISRSEQYKLDSGYVFKGGGDLRASEPVCPHPRPFKPRADTLADHTALKLGKGARDLKHEPPGRCSRVNGLLVKVQIDAATLQLLNRAKEVD